jgi:hypothetical protein
MKQKITYSILAAAAACGMALGQTAHTDPVGYTTTTVYGAFGPGAPKTSVIAPDMQNPASYSGEITAIAGDTLTLSAAAFTPSAFDNISDQFVGGVFYAYFIETADGYWSHIDSNDATSVTVEAGSGVNFAVSDVVKIRRHVTIADYFGANNDFGLQDDGGSLDAGEADNIILIDEVNSSSILVFPTNGLGGDWATDNLDNGAIVPIYPDQGLQVARKGLTNIDIVVEGEVDVNGRQIMINTGLQIRPFVIPVETTLDQIGLYTGDNTTGVQDDGGSLSAGDADNIQVLVDGDTFTYFVTTGFGPAQWVDDNLDPAPVLPAGAGLLVNRSNPTESSPFVWTIPGPVIGQ